MLPPTKEVSYPHARAHSGAPPARRAAPGRPTCVTDRSARQIDYFVHSAGLGGSSVTIDDDIYFTPHRAVRMGVWPTKSRGADLVPIMRRPRPFPTHAVIGPQLQPPCWQTALEACETFFNV